MDRCHLRAIRNRRPTSHFFFTVERIFLRLRQSGRQKLLAICFRVRVEERPTQTACGKLSLPPSLQPETPKVHTDISQISHSSGSDISVSVNLRKCQHLASSPLISGATYVLASSAPSSSHTRYRPFPSHFPHCRPPLLLPPITAKKPD